MIKEGQLYRTSDREFILRVEKVSGDIVYVLVLHRGKVKGAAIPQDNFRRSLVKNDFVNLEKGEIRDAERRYDTALKIDPREKDNTKNNTIKVIQVNDPIQGKGIIIFKDKKVTATLFQDAGLKRDSLPPTAPLPISRQDQPNSFFDYTVLGMGAYWLDDYFQRKYGTHITDALKNIRSEIKDFWAGNYPRPQQLVRGSLSGIPGMLLDDKELHVAPFQRYSKFNTIFRGSKAPGVDEAVDLLVRKYHEKRNNLKDPNQLTTYRSRFIKSDVSMVPQILKRQEEKAIELEEMYHGTKWQQRYSRTKFAERLYTTPEVLAHEFGGLFGKEFMEDAFGRLAAGESPEEIVNKIREDLHIAVTDANRKNIKRFIKFLEGREKDLQYSSSIINSIPYNGIIPSIETTFHGIIKPIVRQGGFLRTRRTYPTWYLKIRDQNLSDLTANIPALEDLRGVVRPFAHERGGNFFNITQMYKAVEQMQRSQKVMLLDIETIADIPFEISTAIVDPTKEGIHQIRDKAYENRVFHISEQKQVDRMKKLFTILKDFSTMPGAGDMNSGILKESLTGVLKKHFHKEDVGAAFLEITRMADLAQGERYSKMAEDTHPLNALIKQLKPGAEFEQFFARAKTGMGPRLKDQKSAVDFVMKQIETAVREGIPVMGHNLTEFDIPKLEWLLARHGKSINPKFYDLIIDMLPMSKLKYKNLSKQYQGKHGNFFLAGRGIEDFMRVLKGKDYRERHAAFADIADTMEVFRGFFKEFIDPRTLMIKESTIPRGTLFFAPEAYAGNQADLPHFWRTHDPAMYGGRQVFMRRNFYRFEGMKQEGNKFLFYFDTVQTETGKIETSVIAARTPEEGRAIIEGTLRVVAEKGKQIPSGFKPINLESMARSLGVPVEEATKEIYKRQQISNISNTLRRAQTNVYTFAHLMEQGREVFGVNELPQFPGLRYPGGKLSRREISRLKNVLSPEDTIHLKNTLRNLGQFYGLPIEKHIMPALAQGEITPYEANEFIKEYTKKFGIKEDEFFLKKLSSPFYYENVNLGISQKIRDRIIDDATNSKKMSREDITELSEKLKNLEEKAIKYEKGFHEHTVVALNKYLGQVKKYLEPVYGEESHAKLAEIMEGTLKDANLSPDIIKDYRKFIRDSDINLKEKGVELLSNRIADGIDSHADVVKTIQSYQERQIETSPQVIKNILRPITFKSKQLSATKETLKLIKGRPPAGISLEAWQVFKNQIEEIPEYVSGLPWKYRGQFEHIESVVKAYHSEGLGVAVDTIKTPGAKFSHAVRLGVYNPNQFTEEYIRNAMGSKTPIIEKGFTTIELPLAQQGIVAVNSTERVVGFYKRNLVRENPYLLGKLSKDEMVSWLGAFAASLVNSRESMKQSILEGNDDRSRQILFRLKSRHNALSDKFLGALPSEIRKAEEKLSAEGIYTWPISYSRELGFPTGSKSIMDYVSQFAVKVSRKPQITGQTNVVREIVDNLMKENPDLFGWIKPEHLIHTLSGYDIRRLFPFGHLIPQEDVAKPFLRQLLTSRYLPEIQNILKEGGTRGSVSALPPFMTEGRLNALKAGVSLNELYAPALIVPAGRGLPGKKFSQVTKSLGNQLENVINYYEANKLGGVTHRTAENAEAFDMLSKLKFLRDTGGVGTVEGMEIISEKLARQMAHNIPHVVTTAVLPQRINLDETDVMVKGYVERAMKGELRYGEQVALKPGQAIATILSESTTQAGKFQHELIKNTSKHEAFLTAIKSTGTGAISFELKYKYPGLRELQKIIGQKSKGIAVIMPNEFWQGGPGFGGIIKSGLKAGEPQPERMFFSASPHTHVVALMNRAEYIARREGRLTQLIDALNQGARDKSERIRLEKDLFPDLPGRLQPIMSDKWGVPEGLKTQKEYEKHFNQVKSRVTKAMSVAGIDSMEMASLEFGKAFYSPAVGLNLASFEFWPQRGISLNYMDWRNMFNRGETNVTDWIEKHMQMTERGKELTKTLYMGLSGVNEQAVRVLRGVEIVDALHEGTTLEQLKGKAIRLPVPIQIHQDIKLDKLNAVRKEYFSPINYLYMTNIEKSAENQVFREQIERAQERAFKSLRQLNTIQDRTSHQFKTNLEVFTQRASDYMEMAGNLFPKELKKAFTAVEIPYSARGIAMMHHNLKPGQIFISEEMFESLGLKKGLQETEEGKKFYDAVMKGEKSFHGVLGRDPKIHSFSNLVAEIYVNKGVPSHAIAASYEMKAAMQLDFDTDNLGFFVPHGNAATKFIESNSTLAKYSEASSKTIVAMAEETKRILGEKYKTSGEVLESLKGDWSSIFSTNEEWKQFYEKYILTTGQVTSLMENAHLSAGALVERGKLESSGVLREFADVYAQVFHDYLGGFKQAASISAKHIKGVSGSEAGAISRKARYEDVISNFNKLFDLKNETDRLAGINDVVNLAKEMGVPEIARSMQKIDPMSNLTRTRPAETSIENFRTALDIWTKYGQDLRTVRMDPLAQFGLSSKSRDIFQLSLFNKMFQGEFNKDSLFGKLAGNVMNLPGKPGSVSQLGNGGFVSPLDTDWSNVSKGTVDLFSATDLTSPIHKFQGMIRGSESVKSLGYIGLGASAIYLGKKTFGPPPVALDRPPGYEKLDQLQDEQGNMYDKIRTVTVGMKQEDMPEYHTLHGSVSGTVPKELSANKIQNKIYNYINQYYGQGSSNVMIKDDRQKVNHFYVDAILR